MNESESEPNNSKIYVFFAFLLVILAGVAYARLPAVRGIVDAKAPWFREKVGHYLVSVVPGAGPQASSGDAPAAAAAGGTFDRAGFDLATFSAHPESWPKSVAIKFQTEFPAVMDGKQVGKGTIVAPAGSEVHLVNVMNGKLGVEYRGGGKWLPPEATDLSERLQAGAAPHP